jgi:hypothetical protein
MFATLFMCSHKYSWCVWIVESTSIFRKVMYHLINFGGINSFLMYILIITHDEWGVDRSTYSISQTK